MNQCLHYLQTAKHAQYYTGVCTTAVTADLVLAILGLLERDRQSEN